MFDNCSLNATRATLDETIDKNGNLLVEIMESNEFIVANGRSRSDRLGHYTFFNSQGKSIIDHIWIKRCSLSLVCDFEIDSKFVLSDHFPCMISLGSDSALHPSAGAEINNFKQYCRWNAENGNKFTEIIQASDTPDSSLSVDFRYVEFMDTIKESIEKSNMTVMIKNNSNTRLSKNKPWYNEACYSMKRLVRNLGRKFKNNPADNYLNDFLAAKREYKAKLKNCRALYYKELENKLGNTQNATDFWKTVKSLNPKKRQSNPIALEHWEQYLNNYYSVRPLIEYEKYLRLDARHPYLDSIISSYELNVCLKKLKKNKAPGDDQVTNEFFKALPINWTTYFLDLLNTIFESEEMPRDWASAELKFIFKKGDISDPANYRRLAMQKTSAKIFTQILATRISKWCESYNILSELQSGFRPMRGCTDNIFSLSCIMHISLGIKSRPIYAIFVDFAQAFDSINHNILWRKLLEEGLSSKIVRIVTKFYETASVAVEINQCRTNKIPVNSGVLQGDPLSPILFSLFLNDFEAFLKSKGIPGVSIDCKTDITCLLYADDIVLLADTPINAQRLLDALSEYCDINKLTVNTTKTKVLVCHKGRKRTTRDLLYNGEIIEQVNRYTYLGVTFSSSGLFSLAAQDMTSKANVALGAINRILVDAKVKNWNSRVKLFESVTLSTLLYSAEIWGLRYSDTIEKVQSRFLKTILTLPTRTPGCMIRLEADRPKLAYFVFQRALNWLYKLLLMSNERIPKLCFNKLRERDQTPTNQIKFNWASQIRELFDKCDMLTIWDSQSCTLLKANIKGILKNFRNILRKTDIERISTLDEYNFYKSIHPSSNPASYLTITANICKTRLITQIRMQKDKDIMIFLGGNRFSFNADDSCAVCNSSKQDDIFHLFVECPHYNSLRSIYLHRYNQCLNTLNFCKLFEVDTAEKLNDVFQFTIFALRQRSFLLDEL